MQAVQLNRLHKELQMLEAEPPSGIYAWMKDGVNMTQLEGKIEGPDGSPYEKGIFRLDITIPDRYPFAPPLVRFRTQIYHPNIDSAGRICLDTLSMPPKGCWTPSLNVLTVLRTLQLLLSEPNPEDPLMADITEEYKHNYPKFLETARTWTRRYAVDGAAAEETPKPEPASAITSPPPPIPTVTSPPPPVASPPFKKKKNATATSSSPKPSPKEKKRHSTPPPSPKPLKTAKEPSKKTAKETSPPPEEEEEEFDFFAESPKKAAATAAAAAAKSPAKPARRSLSTKRK